MATEPNRIMVIGAHPADPFERAGGTVAKHLARGDGAMMVALTSGAVTHAFTSFPATGKDKLRDFDAVVESKHEEFGRAAQALGIEEWRVLDFPESPLVIDRDSYIAMVDLIREYRPQVVICQHPVEVGRQDHMDAGRFAIAAVDYARAEGFPSELAPHTVPHLFMSYYQDFPSEQLMGGPRHAPEVVVDTSSVIDVKREAMLQFGVTQTKQDEDYRHKLDIFFERVDGAAGYIHGFNYAERFTRWHPERVQYLPLND